MIDIESEQLIDNQPHGITPNVPSMVEFAQHFFGGLDGYIYLMLRNPKDKSQNSPIEISKYAAPENINSFFINTQSQTRSIEYAIGTVKDDQPGTTNSADNMVATQMAWVDVDALKAFDNYFRDENGNLASKSPYPSGAEFSNYLLTHTEYSDLSTLVRSSQHGMQLLWKLTKPFEYAGDKDKFDRQLQPLLYRMAYFFGGDTAVCKAHMPMRLPGSLNLKNKNDYLVNAIYPSYAAGSTDLPKYGLQALGNRFDVTPEHCPLVFLHTILTLIEQTDAMGTANRHEFLMRLCGTLRKGCDVDSLPPKGKAVGGIGKETCESLILKIMDHFGDTDRRDRMALVESTYDAKKTPDTKLASLKGSDDESWRSLHYALMPVLYEWVKQQRTFCNYFNLPWHMEWMTEENASISAEEGNGRFRTIIRETGVETKYLPDGENAEYVSFGNFVVKIIANVIKAETKSKVWQAHLYVDGEPIEHPTIIEISSSDHDSATSFKKIKGMPAGMAVHEKKYWDQYVAFLAESAPKKRIVEMPYYGVLNPKDDQPTFLIPGRENNKFVWAGDGEDTKHQDVNLLDPLDDEEKRSYLESFITHYAGFHEPRYLWPALGWMVSCPLSAWLHEIIGGFPTMMVTGLPGSGKSQLMKLLGHNFGAITDSGYEGTTIFSIMRHLTSNNIIPFILDEFRINNSQKTLALQGNIRSLWDKSQSSAGRSDRTVVHTTFSNPLCIMGEHHYQDEATLHRTYSIRIDRTWVNYVREKMDEPQREWNRRQQSWLGQKKNLGMLGTIVWQFIEANAAEIKELITYCNDKISEESIVRGLVTERKVKACAGVFSGLVLMKAICKEYGIAFPITTTEMIECVFTADPELSDYSNHDTNTLRTLFRKTDIAFTEAMTAGRSMRGSVILFDPDDPEIAYMSVTRWHECVSKKLSGDASASLSDLSSFYALLKDSARTEGSAILGEYTKHPSFKVDCWKLNLKRVQNLYNVNTDQWNREEDFQRRDD